MSISSVADTLYAVRFLKLLVTDWEDTEAFKLGLIDKKGKKLERPRTQEEKEAYTLFHRLVFNVKRLIPFQAMQSKLSSYAAAVYLVKEHLDLSDEQVLELLEQVVDVEPDAITESWFAPCDDLLPGTYTLTNTIAHPKTLDMIGNPGNQVIVTEHTEPVDTIFGSYVYPVKHINTNQTIYVTIGDLER